jgi:hypothetical protein
VVLCIHERIVVSLVIIFSFEIAIAFVKTFPNFEEKNLRMHFVLFLQTNSTGSLCAAWKLVRSLWQLTWNARSLQPDISRSVSTLRWP